MRKASRAENSDDLDLVFSFTIVLIVYAKQFYLKSIKNTMDNNKKVSEPDDIRTSQLKPSLCRGTFFWFRNNALS